MKRVFVLFLITILLNGCSGQSQEPKTISEKIEDPVIYAEQLVDGVYKITVDSDSSMFHVVDCQLTVSNGTMTAAMTMSGQGYGMIYAGTKEKANLDTKDNFIPFILDENGGKVFTVPVEALNLELNYAAWSIRKETWYDRTLVFKSTELPAEAFLKE